MGGSNEVTILHSWMVAIDIVVLEIQLSSLSSDLARPNDLA